MNDEAKSFRTGDPIAPGRTSAAALAFAPGDSVVYPGHGVGTVTSVENRCVGDDELRLLYGQALGRLVQELAAVYNTRIEEATTKLELLLNPA